MTRAHNKTASRPTVFTDAACKQTRTCQHGTEATSGKIKIFTRVTGITISCPKALLRDITLAGYTMRKSETFSHHTCLLTELPARWCCGCKKQLEKTLEGKVETRWVCSRTTAAHGRSESRLVELLFWPAKAVLTSPVSPLLFKTPRYSNALSRSTSEATTMISTPWLTDKPCAVNRPLQLPATLL